MNRKTIVITIAFLSLIIVALVGNSGSAQPSVEALRPSAPPTNGEGAASAPHGAIEAAAFDCGVSSYYDFVRTLMQSTIGDVLADAVYDPEIFNSLARSAKRGWEGADSFVWDLSLRKKAPVAPLHFNNVSNILWWTKRLISVGFGRLHRDAELEALMRHSCHSAVSFRLFEQHVRRTIESLVGYFHTVLQLAVDTAAASTKRELLDAAAKLDASLDPLVLIATTIGAATSIGDVAAVFQDGALSLHVEKVAKKYSNVLANKRINALFPLYYDQAVFDVQDPPNGKFWNMIRPTTTCSSFVRLCELPDGCRLICNAEYLLFAGTGHTFSIANGATRDVVTSPFFHRISGFGGNNDYDWEVSLERSFSTAKKQHSGGINQLGWITTFDCTLTKDVGPRQWRPPQVLREGKVGFGYASLCLDGNRTEKSLSMVNLKDFLVRSEDEGSRGVVEGLATRFTIDNAAKAAPLSSKPHHKARTLAGPNPVRLFDAITILKTDVEGYEFNMIPSWARDELRNIAQTTPAAVAEGATSIIDFEVAADDYLSVSLYSMEFHRAGHAQPHGARLRGALRAHWLLLHIYSLGFVMAGQEKNHYDNCCYELVWVSQRHFVRSEMWMVLRDNM